MSKPILTIGIPTYNRVHLLTHLLDILIHQIKQSNCESLVEVVVSDNCSTDDTMELVKALSEKHRFIRYSRNGQNIGANNNILKIGNELAKGEYCWILGDDDLLRENALKEIVGHLFKANTDVIYVNQSYEYINRRDDINLKCFSLDNLLSRYLDNALLENGQKVLDYTEATALFTSVSSLIFKTSIWRKNFIGYQTSVRFNSLNNTFPHSVILAKSIIQKPVYYIGYPYLAFFIGAQDWLSEWPYLNFIRVLELSDLFEKFGANKKFLQKYRKAVFISSGEVYFQLITSKDNNYSKYFDWKSMLAKYYKDRNFLIMNYNLKRKFAVHFLKKVINFNKYSKA